MEVRSSGISNGTGCWHRGMIDSAGGALAKITNTDHVNTDDLSAAPNSRNRVLYGGRARATARETIRICMH